MGENNDPTQLANFSDEEKDNSRRHMMGPGQDGVNNNAMQPNTERDRLGNERRDDSGEMPEQDAGGFF